MTTVHEEISLFLHACKNTRRLDSKTLQAYKTDLSQFEAYLSLHQLPFYEKETLNGYLESLHSRYSPATVKRKIASLKVFFHSLERNNEIPNPFHRLDTSFREPRCLPRFIPLHTVQDLIKYVRQSRMEIPSAQGKKSLLRDLAVIELLFSSGLRISELCLLPASSVDLQAMEMKIYGKGAKERLLQLSSSVVDTLSEYYSAFQEEIDREGYFFVSTRGGHLSDQSVRYMLNKYIKEIGSQAHITPHMFRHTFAKSLLEQDVDIRIIQTILGHSSITTTQRYTFVSSNKQKEVLQSKNPLSLLDLS